MTISETILQRHTSAGESLSGEDQLDLDINYRSGNKSFRVDQYSYK